MKSYIKDKEFLNSVKHVITDKEFIKLANFNHHGTSRVNHLLGVSYFSYKITKRLGLDYKTAAVSGLLHDFFGHLNTNCIVAVFKHATIAADNAEKRFKITPKEKNIIETHMFPLNLKPSLYIEGWIVSTVDKIIGTYEYIYKFKYQLSLWSTIVLNIIGLGGK